VTGGSRTLDGMSESGFKVSVFDIGGWIEDLPDMSWRSDHACGHYIDGNNKIVYLVAGGLNWNSNYATDSTEILTEGASSWTQVGSLPASMYGMSAVSLQNSIILTGKRGL